KLDRRSSQRTVMEGSGGGGTVMEGSGGTGIGAVVDEEGGVEEVGGEVLKRC
ncbi:hypothetical protein U1Q18_031378, partial [Sarracenia purpurea var. burkii]